MSNTTHDFEEQTKIPIAIGLFPTNQSNQILHNASFKKILPWTPVSGHFISPFTDQAMESCKQNKTTQLMAVSHRSIILSTAPIKIWIPDQTQMDMKILITMSTNKMLSFHWTLSTFKCTLEGWQNASKCQGKQKHY